MRATAWRIFLKFTGIKGHALNRLKAAATISLCLITQNERDTDYSFLTNNSDSQIRYLYSLSNKEALQTSGFFSFAN